ncbi:MAG: hypothetical protein WC280_02610 [Patescibacteria group bacterium]
MKKIRIYTHNSPDIDAVASVWFFLRFILRKSINEVEIIFKPANWDGEEMRENDVALDISAGGRGIKGDQKGSKVGSAFMSLFKKAELGHFEKKSLSSLAYFIEEHDSKGISSWRYLRIDERNKLSFYTFAGLMTILHSYQITNSEYDTCLKIFEILDNYLQMLVVEKRNFEEANKNVEVFGKVALVKNAKTRINNNLFNQGFKLVVYVDDDNIGVLSRDGNPRADNYMVKEIVLKSGENLGDGDNWFAHPSGRLFCRGSRKSPVLTPSKVDPKKLAEAASIYLSRLERGED